MQEHTGSFTLLALAMMIFPH